MEYSRNKNRIIISANFEESAFIFKAIDVYLSTLVFNKTSKELMENEVLRVKATQISDALNKLLEN